MTEVSIDEMYDVIDDLGKEGPAEVVRIRNLFLTSAFGEDVLKIFEHNDQEAEGDAKTVKKKVVSGKSRSTGK
jgi:hypothetical protein